MHGRHHHQHCHLTDFSRQHTPGGVGFTFLWRCLSCWQVGAIDPEYDGQDDKAQPQQQAQSKLGGYLKRGLRSLMS
jgi:hypothetical protein